MHIHTVMRGFYSNKFASVDIQHERGIYVVIYIVNNRNNTKVIKPNITICSKAVKKIRIVQSLI